mgnify:CR=1 FL=1
MTYNHMMCVLGCHRPGVGPLEGSPDVDDGRVNDLTRGNRPGLHESHAF